MSSSRDIRAEALPLPPDLLGPASSDYRGAERRVADALDLDPSDVAQWDDGSLVLNIDDRMVQKCQALIHDDPPIKAAEILIALLRESYHLRSVHELIVQLTVRYYREWQEGQHTEEVRGVLRDLSHAFRYGVRLEDFDLLIELASEESFRYDGRGNLDGEDLRVYWVECLSKVKDGRVGDFLRQIIRDDINNWTDYRAGTALRGLSRFWQPTDTETVRRYATDHPDSESRQIARRVLKRHSQAQ